MGTADVIPGVSGGTMAFILGIYTELIGAIKSFDGAWLLAVLRLDIKSSISRPHFNFLIPLGTGLLCALLFFTRVVPLPQLLLIYPEQIYGLFFGLIAGSIMVLVKDMQRLKLEDALVLLPGIVLGLTVFNLVPVNTPESTWFVFLSGALAICAMILPGISGSFILLILKKYSYIFYAVGYFEFSILVPFCLGAIAGLAIFSRALAYLLNRYYRATILFITGLLIASLYVIWPYQERTYEIVGGKPHLIATTPIIPGEMSSAVMLSIALGIAGLLSVITISRIALSKQPLEGD